MGLISEVLTKYRADVGDHVKELKKLKGEEKDRAKHLIEDNERIEKSLGQQIETLGKVGMAAGAMYASFKLGTSIMRDVAEHSKLMAATQGISIGHVSNSVKGLRTEMDLLRDASQLNAGEFKLTTEQIVIAEQAMLQLTRQGHDWNKASQAVTDAIVKLKIDALGDLGVRIDKGSNAMKTQADRAAMLKTVMAELGKVSGEFGKQALTQAEQYTAAANKLTDAFDNALNSLKKYAFQAGSGIGIGAGKAVEGILGFGVGDVGMTGRTGAEYATDYVTRGKLLQEAIEAANRGDAAALHRLGYRNLPDKLAYTTTRAEPPKTGSPKTISTSSAAAATLDVAQTLARYASVLAANENGPSLGGATSAFLSRGGLLGDGSLGSAAGYSGVSTAALASANASAMTNAWKTDVAARQARNKSFLESSFGKIEEFNEYAAAFGMLSSAVTSAMDAWITGSESMATAIKKAIGAGLKALAADLAMQALKHGAYAIGSLAFGDVRGASLHGTAAAQFAAGAVAAGVAARAMGHGGTDYGKSGGGGGAGAASGRPSAANSNAPAQSSIVYVVGDPFDTETNPRRRQQNAKRLLQQTGYSPAAGGDY